MSITDLTVYEATHLPEETWEQIFSSLEPQELYPLRRVCTYFKTMIDTKFKKMRDVLINALIEMRKSDLNNLIKDDRFTFLGKTYQLHELHPAVDSGFVRVRAKEALERHLGEIKTIFQKIDQTHLQEYLIQHGTFCFPELAARAKTFVQNALNTPTKDGIFVCIFPFHFDCTLVISVLPYKTKEPQNNEVCVFLDRDHIKDDGRRFQVCDQSKHLMITADLPIQLKECYLSFHNQLKQLEPNPSPNAIQPLQSSLTQKLLSNILATVKEKFFG